MTEYNLFDFDLEGLREVMAQSYNLWDFDLERYRKMITQRDIGGCFASFDVEAYKEATKPVNLMGGFINWKEHLHQNGLYSESHPFDVL